MAAAPISQFSSIKVVENNTWNLYLHIQSCFLIPRNSRSRSRFWAGDSDTGEGFSFPGAIPGRGPASRRQTGWKRAFLAREAFLIFLWKSLSRFPRVFPPSPCPRRGCCSNFPIPGCNSSGRCIIPTPPPPPPSLGKLRFWG